MFLLIELAHYITEFKEFKVILNLKKFRIARVSPRTTRCVWFWWTLHRVMCHETSWNVMHEESLPICSMRALLNVSQNWARYSMWSCSFIPFVSLHFVWKRKMFSAGKSFGSVSSLSVNIITKLIFGKFTHLLSFTKLCVSKRDSPLMRYNIYKNGFGKWTLIDIIYLM